MSQHKNLHIRSITQYIKKTAIELGFDDVGIARAESLYDEAHILEKWLAQGRHGNMSYMENHFDIRVDPTRLFPGAKSIICLSYNYYTNKKQLDPDAPKIAKYAYGRDYHKVIRKKLKNFLSKIQKQVGEVQGRCFVDSGPVLERTWAARSGLGWIGKNTLLLTKKKGSYFFLAEIILDIELDYDHPVKNYCASCTKCIDACPTDAIYAPYQLDASKCISYLTIELRDDSIPGTFKNNMDQWAFGCDICQDVCPINARAKPHQEPDFEPQDKLLSMKKEEWEEITEEIFDKLFVGSAVKRAKFKGLKRNINFLK